MLNTYRKVETTTGEEITIETSFDSDRRSFTKEGWSACLNGFDLDVRQQHGATEEAAIENLLLDHDIELKNGVKALLETTQKS